MSGMKKVGWKVEEINSNMKKLTINHRTSRLNKKPANH